MSVGGDGVGLKEEVSVQEQAGQPGFEHDRFVPFAFRLGAKFRRTKGAVKLHLLLDHDGYLPSFAVITDGRQHESRVARLLRFAVGTILVFDRGYIDYQWFADLTRAGVYLVTRMKDNADYEVVE